MLSHLHPVLIRPSISNEPISIEQLPSDKLRSVGCENLHVKNR